MGTVTAMLGCNVAHIQAGDDLEIRWLAAHGGCDGLRVVPRPGGFLLRDTGLGGHAGRDEVTGGRFSGAFWGVLDEARRLGCAWVDLGEDADQVPGLPVFER